MKANKTPEKIYLTKNLLGELSDGWDALPSETFTNIEYTRTDAFIEKTVKFLKSYRQDTLDGMGYIAGIVNDKTIEDFKNYMEGK